MITFLDEQDVEYGAQVEFKNINGVNGERSISGTIYTNEDVLNRIDKGWRLRFNNEYYVIIYSQPVDLGNVIEVEFDAVHQFFYDFKKSIVHQELNGSNTFAAYIRFIFQDSGYEYRIEGQVNAIEKQSFGFKDRLTLFNDIIKSSGAEFQVNGRVVRIMPRVGTDLSTIVKKNFNLNELKIEKNINDFVTYKKGYGAWFDEEDHSKGRLEVEYASPLMSIYGKIEGEPIIDERYTNAESLKKKLKDEVENSYSISVSMDFEDLTKAGYQYEQPVAGDYIMAINDDVQFREKIRIVSFESHYDVAGNLINHKVTCNDIGSVKKREADYAHMSKTIVSQQEVQTKALEIANKALVSANGKNKNYYGTEMPVDKPKGTLIVGDTLFLRVGDRVKRYYWNGSDWIVDPFDEDINYVKNQLTEVFNQFDTERTETEQAINEALESAKAEAERLDEERQLIIDGQIAEVISQADSDRQSTSESISNAISEAERLANEIYKYYDTALLTTIWYRGESSEMQRISGQKNLVGLLVETAQISKEQANKAYLDAVEEAESKVQAKDAEYQSVFDTYDLILNQATQDIQTSLSKADDALEEAGISTNIADTAKGLAEQAKQSAEEAKHGAEQAKTESEQAKAEVATIPTKISNYIDSKGLVDGTFVDEKVDEAAGAWSLELAKVESLVLPETFTVLTATWLRGESPQMNLSQVKNRIPQRGHILYGAIWTKGHEPKMKRTTGAQALGESVSIFGAEYKRDVEGIYHELTRIESNIPSLDGYATQYWANEKFETAEKVQQTLSAYTEETIMPVLDGKANIDDIPDLTPYAQITWVQNQGYQTASEISSTLTKYTTETLQPALADKADLDDIPDISGKADKSEIPSLSGYAKESWVENKNYQTASEINQILTSYTKTSELNSALANKADKSEIPSLTGYAKESWVENKNYQTASDVTQTLTNYAKVSDLTGMVTESTLATKNYVTAGTMSTTLTNYLKTTDLNNKIQETTAFQDVKETTNRFTRVIGSTDAEAKTNIAQIAMSDQIFQTSVNDILDDKGYITDTTLTMSATWVKGADPVMQRTSKLEELIRLANSAQSGVEKINRNIKLESIMGMTWFKRPSPRMQPINKLDALNSAVSVAQSKITQLSDMIDLRVTKEGLIGAINIQAGKTIFQQGTNKLMLTTDTFYMPSATIESAQIKNINASKIYGTSAEFNSVRAGVLTANAVKSTHIEASTTLIDKLFATSALIGELTSKTAFIDSIKAVEIDASKITSGTIDSARIDAKTIVTNGLQANVIRAEHLLTDVAFFNKIFTGATMTDKLVAKGAWITNANISSLDASKITSGTIDTARLDAKAIVTNGLQADVIKSTHILADNALFEKLFTDDLATEKLATKQAWIKSSMIGEAQIGTAQIGQIDASNGRIVNLDASTITSGTMTANRIRGGVLSSTNGATSFDLNTGQLSFQQDGVAVKNQFSGRPLQYLTFKTGTYAGSEGSYTALMSNSGNSASMDKNSAGIQIWNNFDKKTAITLYGNTITFRRNADVNVTEQIDIDTVNRAIKHVNTINNLRIVPMSISGTSGVALMYGNDAGLWIGGYGDFAFKHNGVWIGKAQIIN